MHESTQSDIHPPEAESQPYQEESKCDDGTASDHPWLQLQTITPFEQLTMSSSGSCSEVKPACSDSIIRTSGSSETSCSNTDESSDVEPEDFPVKSTQQQKKFKRHNGHYSDPSHDRLLPRQGSSSSYSQSGLDGSNLSLKHKISSSESASESRHHRLYSASIDETVSDVSKANNTNQYRLAVNGSKAVRTMGNTLSSSLMIESLIDQICKMMIRDTKHQQAMYKIVCNKLYDMGIIDKTYTLDELQIVRNHYQKALYQMFTMGRSVTQASQTSQTEFLLPLASVKIERPLGQSVMEVSRYKGEFEELKFLARGGFGKVYRVRHRLDGALYAVKKIFFRNNDHIMQSVREVKMLANLNHPNVVAYKAAWIEPVEYKDYENISTTSTRSTGTGTNTNNSSNCLEMDMPSVHHGDCPDSEDIVFAESIGDGVKIGAGDSPRGAANPRVTIECVHEKVTKRTTATVAYDSGGSLRRSVVENKSVVSSSVSNAVSNAVQPYRSSRFSKEIRNKKRVELAVLYVQMQLCELTLRQWLDSRNSSTDLDVASIFPNGLNLFQQIVRGVEYIHAQKIVHHDIKPSNIFLSNDLSLVQVGDFGLSCYFTSQLKHGCNIGTPQYAAPEQQKGECNPKSDIFSLGIILVEILVPFHTTMERVAIVQNLRRGKVPDQLEATSPAIAELVRRLVETQSPLRPTATELLTELQNVERLKFISQCLDEKNKIINEISAKYEAVIESKDKEIFELKKRLRELEEFHKEAGKELDVLP